MFRRNHDAYVSKSEVNFHKFFSKLHLDTFLGKSHRTAGFDPWWENMTVTDCVFNKTCLYQQVFRSTSMQIRWFCGHNHDCDKGTQTSLNLAKYNVETTFSVVGLTEDLESTFYLFEGKIKIINYE